MNPNALPIPIMVKVLTSPTPECPKPSITNRVAETTSLRQDRLLGTGERFAKSELADQDQTQRKLREIEEGKKKNAPLYPRLTL
jgi:hypothetical protein